MNAKVHADLIDLIARILDKPRKAEPAAEDSARDAVLLQQINAQISRTAPMAMEPLLIWLEDNSPTSNTIGEER
jgi:hypothetical protein